MTSTKICLLINVNSHLKHLFHVTVIQIVQNLLQKWKSIQFVKKCNLHLNSKYSEILLSTKYRLASGKIYNIFEFEYTFKFYPHPKNLGEILIFK